MHNQEAYKDIVKAFEELKKEVNEKQALFLKIYTGKYPSKGVLVDYFTWGSGNDHKQWEDIAGKIVKKALNLQVAIKQKVDY